MKVRILLLACFLLAGCGQADRQLLTSSREVGQKPLIIVPRPALQASSYFNVLCIAVPREYQLEASGLRDPSGQVVVLEAILTTQDGRKHIFTHSGVLQGRYLCLQADPSIGLGHRYKEISISSSAPLHISDIRWISTDKL
jgi:hypothetical protein